MRGFEIIFILVFVWLTVPSITHVLNTHAVRTHTIVSYASFHRKNATHYESYASNSGFSLPSWNIDMSVDYRILSEYEVVGPFPYVSLECVNDLTFTWHMNTEDRQMSWHKQRVEINHGCRSCTLSLMYEDSKITNFTVTLPYYVYVQLTIEPKWHWINFLPL